MGFYFILCGIWSLSDKYSELPTYMENLYRTRTPDTTCTTRTHASYFIPPSSLDCADGGNFFNLSFAECGRGRGSGGRRRKEGSRSRRRHHSQPRAALLNRFSNALRPFFWIAFSIENRSIRFQHKLVKSGGEIIPENTDLQGT